VWCHHQYPCHKHLLPKSLLQPKHCHHHQSTMK
jgi:hypothetical protein